MSASIFKELRSSLRHTRFPSLPRICAHPRIRFNVSTQLCSGHTIQTRAEHSTQPPSPPPRNAAPRPPPRESPRYASQPGNPRIIDVGKSPSTPGKYASVPLSSEQPPIGEEDFANFPQVRVRYFRPAIWALVVSSGIFVGLSYLEAKRQLRAEDRGRWLKVPQVSWPSSSIQRSSTPPLPTEVATKWWADLNPISKVSYGIIGANTLVHAGSFLVPSLWNTLWHMPARNVNYTQFTSMFVHSGGVHFLVNMYCLNNFMLPVGYSKAFQGSPYHLLSFFLATGVLSGFAQHWSTLIPVQKRAIPEIFIRCGGASGALFGILGTFCMQYPTAGLGIIFIPVHFDAQYVLPAVMLFDFVGMIRGYSFVNFGHAAHFSGAICGVAYSYFDGKKNLWNPLVRAWKQRLVKQ